MRKIVRRAYKATSRRISPERKESIKAVARRVLPPKAQAGLKRRLRRLASGQTLSVVRHEDRLNKQVSSMSRALWMGFTDAATAELEHVRRIGDFPAKPVARAAETLARWHTTNGERERALDRLIHARVLNGAEHPERLRVLEHHLLTELGYYDEADAVFQEWGAESPDLHLIQANLRLRQAQAGLITRADADAERRELIDWVLRQRSFTTVSELVTSDVLDFNALVTSPPPAGITEQDAADPVVSIVVPAYNAGSTLRTSVNSLRAQSIRQIEILVVDDASSDDTAAVAKEIAAEDPRVKVLQHSQNQGAYGARNTGLANAAGEYFTVHDADDWSHPHMLESQLEALRAADAPGSFSRLARVGPQMEFLLRPYRPMLEPIHWNYTSLLVKTETMRAFGGWDQVRAHADAELIERLRAVYGKKSLVEAEPTVPLSFFLVTGDNITEKKGTGLRSVDFGARREYSAQARFWRKRTYTDSEVPTLTGHPRSGTKTPFFAPRSFATNRDQLSRDYDLVIGSDLALKGGTRRCNLAYIDCARALGLRIGIFNMPRYRLKGSGVIDGTYRELFELDDIDLLTPEDEVTARTLLVHHPPALRENFTGYPSVTAESHFLLVNQLPFENTDRSGVQYNARTVHQRFEEKFGHAPMWIPITPRVRDYLGPELPAGDVMHHEDWYPIVNSATRHRPREAGDESRLPIVGRHSRDHATKWPETAEVLEKCYLAGTKYEVRLLGGVDSAEKVLGYCPKNWTVYPFDSVEVDEFLEGIDIFLHFHHSTYIEEFGRNIAEAMAKGIPCILPPDYAETFLDAAVYAEPEMVADAVNELWADRDKYEAYSARGVAFVEQYSGMEAGTKRMAGLLPEKR